MLSVCSSSADMCLLQAALSASQHIGYAGISAQSNGSRRATGEANTSRESPRQPCVRRSGDTEKQAENKIDEERRIGRKRIIEYRGERDRGREWWRKRAN